MSDILDKILSLPKFGNGTGLERTHKTFPELWAHYHSKKHKIIHIVGSNGKGSTANFLNQLSLKLGFQTALFTSPHLYHFSERFQVNGVSADASLINDAWAYFLKGVSKSPYELNDFGSFEAMTVMAAYIFSKSNLDYYIIEAGIGGRFDTSKLFGGHTAILTSVDLEHTHILGDSLKEIASDKADILSEEGFLFLGWLAADLQSHITENAKQKNVHVIDVSQMSSFSVDPLNHKKINIDHTRKQKISVHPRTPSNYLLQNSLLALAATEHLLPSHPTLINAYRDALETFTLMGRFEEISTIPQVICDIAHTPNAIEQLLKTLNQQYPDKKYTFALGISEDKEIGTICTKLAQSSDHFVLFSARHKGASANLLKAHILQQNPNAEITIANNAVDAVKLVKSQIQNENLFIATGGIFSSIEFRTAWLGEDLEKLSFY